MMEDQLESIARGIHSIADGGEGVPKFMSGPMIRRIQDLYAQGYKLNAIAKMFNEEGYPTPSGRGRWHQQTVKRALNYKL